MLLLGLVFHNNRDRSIQQQTSWKQHLLCTRKFHGACSKTQHNVNTWKLAAPTWLKFSQCYMCFLCAEFINKVHKAIKLADITQCETNLHCSKLVAVQKSFAIKDLLFFINLN